MKYDYSDEDRKRLSDALDEYWKECGYSLEKFAEKINLLDVSEKDMLYFRTGLCDQIRGWYGGNWRRFPQKENRQRKQWKKLYFENVNRLPKASQTAYYWSVYYFYKKEYANVHKYLRQYIADKTTNWGKNPGEMLWGRLFLYTFKEAYQGFWHELAVLMRENDYEEKLAVLCEQMDVYYACKTHEEEENVLIDCIQTHSELITPKELLGSLYIEIGHWYSAIQCYEQLEDTFFRKEFTYFKLAWLHGKVNEYAIEEKYYRKCLELDTQGQYTLNNLGYCLYKQRRYNEAEKIFLQCLAENRDLPYPANNLVRTYLRLGKNQDAKDFIAAKKYKVKKSLVNQVKGRPQKNTDADIPPMVDDDDGAIELPSASKNEPAKQQFSSEKILEDELAARIESGQEVFGRKLRIYRRKGDFYGRQYPCSNGDKRWRLDLLCEDEEGNFVIIELKKDSGYDDAYQQTKEYVDYFEKHRVPEGKKVYGLICLNSPTDAVMKKVRQDERIRLFEYKISYTEMK